MHHMDMCKSQRLDQSIIFFLMTMEMERGKRLQLREGRRGGRSREGEGGDRKKEEERNSGRGMKGKR